MTPENIAGFSIPREQLQELIDALATATDPQPLFEYELPKAA